MDKKKAELALKIAVPAVILAYLFATLDLSRLWRNLGRTDPILFLSSFGILCIRNIIGAYRSKMLLEHKKLHFPLLTLSKYYFIGNFFNLFLPEVIGRDIARGYYLYNSTSGKTESIGAIVVERFIGTAALVILSFLSAAAAAAAGLDIMGRRLIGVITGVFGLSGVFMALFFFERTERFLERLSEKIGTARLRDAVEFARGVVAYRRAPRLIAATFLVSMVFQFAGVVATYLLALSLGESTGFHYYLILLPVIWVMGMLPVSINGLGVREGSFVFLFGAVGMPKETAMAVSILWFLQNLGLGLLGGILYVSGGSVSSRTGR